MLLAPDPGICAAAQVAHSDLRWILEHPGWLKTHDWVITAGPLGMYLLQDLLDEPQREAVMAVLK